MIIKSYPDSPMIPPIAETIAHRSNKSTSESVPSSYWEKLLDQIRLVGSIDTKAILVTF